MKKEIMHCDLGEAQGIRIEYKFIKILLSLNFYFNAARLNFNFP